MLRSFLHRLLKEVYPFAKPFFTFPVFAFLTVGGLNTFLNMALFGFFYPLLWPHAFALELATSWAFVLTLISGFWLQRNFAFTNATHHQHSIYQQFIKYSLVSLQGAVGAYGLTKFMVVGLHWNGVVAYGITTVIMLTVTYFLQRYFTFRTRKHT